MTSNVVAPVGGADLEKLTRDLNKLDRTREDHIYQLGMKLIPIRQMLQQMNGPAPGRIGPDGLRPRGWKLWCAAAGISHRTAADAVQRAVDPQRHRLKISARGRYNKMLVGSVVRQLKGASVNWSYKQRQQFHTAYAAVVQEWNAHV